MFPKTIFITGLCLLLLTFASCSDTEDETSKAPVEDVSDDSEVVLSLGDKKLTMQQVEWATRGGDNTRKTQFINWWLENQILYEEAERRGITNELKEKYLAEMRRKSSFSIALRTRVHESVTVSDEMVLEYYENNKETDENLRQRGRMTYSHIKTNTLEEARAAFKRIEKGEDFKELARELSIDNDAQRGGRATPAIYRAVQQRLGEELYQELVAAKAGELVGPAKTETGYEIVLLEENIKPQPLPFERVQGRLKANMLNEERRKAIDALLNPLKEKAASKIVRSPLMLEMEKKAEEEQKTKASQPGRGIPLRRPR